MCITAVQRPPPPILGRQMVEGEDGAEVTAGLSLSGGDGWICSVGAPPTSLPKPLPSDSAVPSGHIQVVGRYSAVEAINLREQEDTLVTLNSM